MNNDAVLDGLLSFGEDDWIALWMIADDVEQELGIEASSEILEATVDLVKGLLKHGFLAGDSPVQNNGIDFRPWPNQNPEAVVDFIRREWARRCDVPTWGDSPWFALPKRPRAAA
jgi:hypothetical protein